MSGLNPKPDTTVEQCSGLGVWVWFCGFGPYEAATRFQSVWCGFWVLSWFRVQGFGPRVQDLGFRVGGLIQAKRALNTLRGRVSNFNLLGHSDPYIVPKVSLQFP